MFPSNNDEFKQISENFKQMIGNVPTRKLLYYPATLLDLHNHGLMTYLYYQSRQADPGPLQLRRFETVSVPFYTSKLNMELTIHQGSQKDRSTCH